MTLLFMDGFDDGLTASKWTTAAGAPATPVAGGRTGLKSGLFSSGSTSLRKTVVTADEHATFILGVALQLPALATMNDFIRFSSDALATTHITLGFNNNLAIEARRGIVGTLLGTTDNNVLVTGASTWQYLEVLVTLHDTTGVVTIKVNGAQVLNLTGIDTKNAGTKTVFESMQLITPAGGNAYVDDVYLCNGAGSVNNTFLGDCTIETILPTGNGNSSQLVGSDADSTDNYLLVDETAPNTSDFAGSATVGNKDTYAFANLAHTTGTVPGIQTSIYAAKSDVGAKSAAKVLRSGTTDYDGTGKVLSTTYVPYLEINETDPDTAAAFTVAGVNALEAGFKVTA